MKRSLKVFTLVLVGLFLCVTGIDMTLDQQSSAVEQNSVVWYNEKGDVVLAYEGDLKFCPTYVKRFTVAPPPYLHRT